MRCVLLTLAAALLALIAISSPTAHALVPVKPLVKAFAALSTHAQALPEGEVARLAVLAKTAGGTKAVGKALGAKRLPDPVLEDAYLRIALYQGALGRSEAEGMYRRLGGTPGFRSALSKMIGNSPVKTAGHLNELRIADRAVQHGFSVKGIGVPFHDGRKGATTDIDVLLEKNGKLFAIEAKDYSPTTPIPMDAFRADMVTLREFQARQAQRQVVPVFAMTSAPGNASVRRLLELEASRRGIQLLFGPVDELLPQLVQLEEIL